MATKWRIMRKRYTDDGPVVSVWLDHYTVEHNAEDDCARLNAGKTRIPKRPDLRDATGELFHPVEIFTVETC